MTLRAVPGDGRFARFWASDALSTFGAEITLLTLPLVAVLWLQATPAQMGVLVASELLPYGLFSLHAGAWIDRMRKVPVLRWGAATRALLLLSVPLAAAMEALRFEWLCAVAFLLATHSVFVDLAYQALLPQLVERETLVRANARLGATQSAAGIAGPGAAGLLTQALGAPFALVVDACALLAAGSLLRRLKVDEPAPPAAPMLARAAISAGLRRVFADPRLRWPMLAQCGWQLLKNAFAAVFLLFAVRDVGLSAAGVGVVTALAGVGFGLSAISSPSLTRRVGLGPAMLIGLALVAVCWSAAPWVRGPFGGAAIGAVTLVEGLGAGWFCLAIVSVRQIAAPPDCLARVIASYRFVTLAAAPLGALLGGIAADVFGLRETLACVGAGAVIATTLIAGASPLARLRIGADVEATPSRTSGPAPSA